MQKTSGQNSISDLNYAAEDLARSKAVIVSNLLQSASYSIDESNKYLDSFHTFFNLFYIYEHSQYFQQTLMNSGASRYFLYQLQIH